MKRDMFGIVHCAVDFIQSAQNLSNLKYGEKKKPGWINKGESNTPDPEKRKYLRNKRK
jgi:hypothetical protein